MPLLCQQCPSGTFRGRTAQEQWRTVSPTRAAVGFAGAALVGVLLLRVVGVQGSGLNRQDAKSAKVTEGSGFRVGRASCPRRGASASRR